VYFLLIGLWPIFSLSTFEQVTGPKLELWLVRTVAALVVVVGVVLLTAAVRRHVSLEVGLLGAASCLVMVVIHVDYGVRGAISPIYFADAALQLLLLMGWGRMAMRGPGGG
jgi:hypothetical protein